VATTDGVTLVVGPVSLELVAGAQVDFIEDLGGASFRSLIPMPPRGAAADRASAFKPGPKGAASRMVMLIIALFHGCRVQPAPKDYRFI
jgi:hypothetical protein